MRAPHVRDPQADARDFRHWVLFVIGAIAGVYVGIPWLILHPTAALGVAVFLLLVCVVSAYMLSSQISRDEENKPWM